MPPERVAQPQQRVVPPDAVREAPLHVVLVEPEIPPNAGNVARLCAATGCALHLVEPLGFRIDDRELKRAGLDYWDALAVVVHPSLDAFLAAFAARRLWLLSTRAKRFYTDADFAPGDALVLGKETAGLPQSLLDAHPDRALRIPMRPGAVRSINLSTAAGVVTYAALARVGFPGLT
jgi:tRNA (cytidine/uridine-2'-O-)-methyltransferase